MKMKVNKLEDKSQSQIIAERRAKRKEMISGVVGNRVKPLILSYDAEDYLLNKMAEEYKKGYDNGYEIGKSVGRSDIFLKGIIVGAIVVVAVSFWLYVLYKNVL